MEEPDWHLWRAFLAVAQTGSLSAAARALRLTQPTLGRQIAALEDALQTTLFTRSTEGLRPTDTALALVPTVAAMAAAASASIRAASAQAGELRGTVRLTASGFIGGVVLPAILARFRLHHPAVDIELSLSDRTEDLLRRDADLAVRNIAPRQAALVVRRIGAVPVTLFAHRDYVARHGLPATIADLAQHSLIGQEDHARQVGSRFGFDLHFGLRCNDDLALLAALQAGYGIGYCQTPVGAQLAGVVPVLPDFVLAHIGIWMVMHEDLRATRRIRALFDHLADELARYVGPEGT